MGPEFTQPRQKQQQGNKNLPLHITGLPQKTKTFRALGHQPCGRGSREERPVLPPHPKSIPTCLVDLQHTPLFPLLHQPMNPPDPALGISRAHRHRLDQPSGYHLPPPSPPRRGNTVTHGSRGCRRALPPSPFIVVSTPQAWADPALHPPRSGAGSPSRSSCTRGRLRGLPGCLPPHAATCSTGTGTPRTTRPGPAPALPIARRSAEFHGGRGGAGRAGRG